MRVEQHLWSEGHAWDRGLADANPNAGLVLVFGATPLLKNGPLLDRVREVYPGARICGCSTAGEIADVRVFENTLSVTAVEFASTGINVADASIADIAESRNVGRRLADELKGGDLAHVLVLSDGLGINGSDLVRGLTEGLPQNVPVTGGLAGDGDRFRETLVISGGSARRGTVTAIGFYGGSIRTGYGSVGGWDPFGPERIITRSSGNILYEMDGKSALGLYRLYLGDQARDLPASGLLFPLSLRIDEGERPVVRTLLAINDDGGMVFAGDMPQGSYARLMKANFDRLIDGAVEAARSSAGILSPLRPELAVLISCVGRRLILKQRVEEEIDGVREELGPRAVLTGFYSYGEISPFAQGERCDLHNQTMTVTAFTET